MSKHDDQSSMAREGQMSRKWSVVRSRTIPSSATVSQLSSSVDPSRADQKRQKGKAGRLQPILHRIPGYFENADTQHLKP